MKPKVPLKEINEKLKKNIKNAKREEDIRGKLLEWLFRSSYYIERSLILLIKKSENS